MSRDVLGEFALVDSPTFQTVLGRVIARRRKQLGRDQSIVAKAAGVTQSTWSRIERGESMMNVEQLFRASREINVALDELLAEVELVLEELEKFGLTVRDAADKTPAIFNLPRSLDIKLLDIQISQFISLAKDPE